MINNIESSVQKIFIKIKKDKIKKDKIKIKKDAIYDISSCLFKLNIKDNSIIKEDNLINNDIIIDNKEPLYDDKYYKETLIRRFNDFKNFYISDIELIKYGLPIRHQNTPEDITENLAKFIIRKYENDYSCVWCKGVDKKYSLTGDLYSNRYDKKYPIEVKSFTSDGPSQFGPNKKFSVLYFLDLRKWLNDEIILWKVNLNNDSDEYKNIKVSKTETIFDQINKGRRPHISWNKIYPQIKEYCEQIYKGTFENIF